MDLSGVDLPDDDDDVLLKIDSELADLQPGESGVDLLGKGARGQEHFFQEERREESEVLLNQLLDTSNEVGNIQHIEHLRIFTSSPATWRLHCRMGGCL